MNSQRATIRKPTTSLSGLPPATTAFGDRAPWSVLTTRTLVATLGIDRGNFATWRCRGIGPAELPSAWFKPTTGSPRYYLVADVMAWLAARHGEPFSVGACWREWFRTETGADIADPAELRRQVMMLAKAAGPRPSEGVVFTSSGFRDYLASLEGEAS